METIMLRQVAPSNLVVILEYMVICYVLNEHLQMLDLIPDLSHIVIQSYNLLTFDLRNALCHLLHFPGLMRIPEYCLLRFDGVSIHGPPYQDVLREVVIIHVCGCHHLLSLYYHVNFGLVSLGDLFLHALTVGLWDNGNDEVHEDNIAHDHYEEPDYPEEDFILWEALVEVVVSKWGSKGHDEEHNWTNTIMILHISHYDWDLNSKEGHNNEEVSQEEPQVKEHRNDHLDQETKLIEDPQVKVELDRKQQEDGTLNNLHDIIIVIIDEGYWNISGIE